MCQIKVYYKYITWVLYTIFGTRRRKGERFGFDPPPGLFFGLREMICLFLGSGVMVGLLRCVQHIIRYGSDDVLMARILYGDTRCVRHGVA